MNNYGIEELIKKINEANPSVNARRDDAKSEGIIVISGNVDPHKLKYPHGYYYNRTFGITNRWRTREASPVSYTVVNDKELA